LKNFEQTLIEIFQPDFDLKISSAITIAIENFSGLIGIRFLYENRSAIFGSKSIPEFHFEIDPRLKTGPGSTNTDGAQDRDPILVRKSIRDFEIKIGS
jgi:hypothetical protein